MQLYKGVPISQKNFTVPATRMVDILEDLKLCTTKLLREGHHDKAQKVAQNAVFIYDLILNQPRPALAEIMPLDMLKDEDIPF